MDYVRSINICNAMTRLTLNLELGRRRYTRMPRGSTISSKPCFCIISLRLAYLSSMRRTTFRTYLSHRLSESSLGCLRALHPRHRALNTSPLQDTREPLHLSVDLLVVRGIIRVRRCQAREVRMVLECQGHRSLQDRAHCCRKLWEVD